MYVCMYVCIDKHHTCTHTGKQSAKFAFAPSGRSKRPRQRSQEPGLLFEVRNQRLNKGSVCMQWHAGMTVMHAFSSAAHIYQ